MAARERGEGRQLGCPCGVGPTVVLNGLERGFGSEELADRVVHGCECGLG